MKEHKEDLIKIIVATILLVVAICLKDISNVTYIVLCILAYLVSGYEVLKEAFEGIIHKEFFDENFLMSIATIGALCLGEFFEAVIVMLLYSIGELLEHIATDRAKKSIENLNKLKPQFAHKFVNNELQDIQAEEIEIGDIILVKVGEEVPCDGVIENGESSFDYSSLTGESSPLKLYKNDKILSGSINLTNPIKIRCEKKCQDSTISKIIEIVNSESSKKSKHEDFITKFSKVYTPIVISLAILLILIPTIITGEFTTWLYRGLIFLVISCPCALVISIPLGFFGGLGACSKIGVLVKSSYNLETLSKLKSVAFDKTGTLTKGSFEVVKIYPEENKEEILKYASILESTSTHPIAKSITNYCGEIGDTSKYEIEELAGFGMIGKNKEDEILVGNSKLLESHNISFEQSVDSGSIVYVAKNSNFLGYIVVSDKVKDDSFEALEKLKELGIKSYMLSGDNKVSCETISKTLKIDSYSHSLLPIDKIKELEKIKQTDGITAFVGDGVNDSPVLSKADLSIAMGKKGSDIAISASDIVILNDNLKSIPKSIKIAKKTLRIVKFNIVFSLVVKVAVLALSALGLANMWLAIVADVGVTILAILNSLRTLLVK